MCHLQNHELFYQLNLGHWRDQLLLYEYASSPFSRITVTPLELDDRSLISSIEMVNWKQTIRKNIKVFVET